jgi:hypothetical protein
MILIRNLKSRKGLCYGLLMGFSVSHGIAQTDEMKERITLKQDAYEATQQKKWAIGAQFGLSQVPGVDVAYQFAPKWQGRMGFGLMKFNTSYEHVLTTQNLQTEVKTPKSVLIDASVRMSQVSAMVEYLPWLSGKIRLIGGLAWFPKKEVSASATLQNVSLGVIQNLTPEEIGRVTVNLGFKSQVSPYLGVGFGKLIPDKRFNISGEVGTYYLGDYKVNSVEVQEGIILKEAEQNAPILERNLNAKPKFKLYPNLSIRVGYRLF